jgi:hypothetical protein
MTVSTREPEQLPTEEDHPRMSWYNRQRMLFDLAARELSYRQIGAKYGKTENNVKQLAWY